MHRKQLSLIVEQLLHSSTTCFLFRWEKKRTIDRWWYTHGQVFVKDIHWMKNSFKISPTSIEWFERKIKKIFGKKIVCPVWIIVCVHRLFFYCALCLLIWIDRSIWLIVSDSFLFSLCLLDRLRIFNDVCLSFSKHAMLILVSRT